MGEIFARARTLCETCCVNLLEARLVFGDLHVVEVATTLPDGSPHVVPLWFVWRDEALYVSARRTSATWRNVERDPRLALTFHQGRAWDELAGAVLYGRADPLSPAHPALHGVMSSWYEKYRALLGGQAFRRYAEQVEDPGMLRVRPERLAQWDNRPKQKAPVRQGRRATETAKRAGATRRRKTADPARGTVRRTGTS
jgi:PPOX class probable F420-dependent enzyme